MQSTSEKIKEAIELTEKLQFRSQKDASAMTRAQVLLRQALADIEKFKIDIRENL